MICHSLSTQVWRLPSFQLSVSGTMLRKYHTATAEHDFILFEFPVSPQYLQSLHIFLLKIHTYNPFINAQGALALSRLGTWAQNTNDLHQIHGCNTKTVMQIGMHSSLLQVPAGAADSGGQEGQPPLLAKSRRGKTISLLLHLADSAGWLCYYRIDWFCWFCDIKTKKIAPAAPKTKFRQLSSDCSIA